MKLLAIGIIMIGINYIWLAYAVSARESPLIYYPDHSQLHFWAFHLYSSTAHIVLAVSATLYLIDRRARAS